MTSTFRYSVYGVTLGSDMELALPSAPESAVTYLQLSRVQSTEIEQIRTLLPPPSDEWGQVSVLNDGAIYMRWNDWLEFVVSPDGRHIAYNPLCAGPPHAFEAYLANFAVSAAMIQHGEEPLHSTVVEWKRRGVGLTGPSGAGKSSLAAHLLTRGGRLVTDDMLRITFRDHHEVFAEPGPLRLKLNADTVPIYAAAMSYRGEWSPDAGKFLFEPTDAAARHDGVRLSALFKLEAPEQDQTASEITLERLQGLDLFTVICASTMNSLVNTPRRLERQLAFAKKIGDTLPVYRLTYPRRHDLLDDVVHAIEEVLA